MELNNHTLQILENNRNEDSQYKVMGATILESVLYEEFWEEVVSLWGILGTSCWNSRSMKT